MTSRSPARAPQSELSRPVETVAGLEALARALLSLRDADEVTRFLRDLCTLPELEALAHRWQIVQLLEQGVPYVEIAERVPTSTATVTRVAQWLRHGTGGYGVALGRRGEERP
ncbi:MAG: YerC/YecD family TrpR-related protein [Gaiella sp.]